MTDRRVSSVAISEVISDAPEIPGISPTTVGRIQRTLGFSYLPPIATLPFIIAGWDRGPHGSSSDDLPDDDGECSTGLAPRITGSESH
jgi:hypothetical protein